MADTTAPPAAANDATETEAVAAAPAPIFGSAATFGAASGFGGFAGVAAKVGATEGEDAEGAEDATAEEECAAEFKPVVQLEEVEVTSGEEEEEALFDVKCKLYRFDNEASEWKERGVGQAKLLKHKESQRVRFIMRQDKTLKIRSNHVVMPGSTVQEHSGSEKAMVWSCVDFADETQRPELFCIRFASPERAQEFKTAYEAAAEANAPLLAAPAEEEGGKEGAGESAAADEAADELAKATVEDSTEAAPAAPVAEEATA